MLHPSIVSRCFLFALWICAISSEDITFGEYPLYEKLDDNFELRWNFNTTHIIFETRVKTNGYVGFGISGNGGMYLSDVIIGWVADGNVSFSDRHATGYTMPAMDESQDWLLINGTESGQYTTLTTLRELDTCDSQDIAIGYGQTHVIYSYHPEDPDSEHSVTYHGANRRGTKSLNLLKSRDTSSEPKPLPSDAVFIDFLNQNYSVPKRKTMYSCTTWKLRDLGSKHHMIRFEPVIQRGHERLIHHIILYFCPNSVSLSDELIGLQYECYSPSQPKEIDACKPVFIAWAIGGKGFDFPDHVGQPLGTPDDPLYFVMETHYDNPALRADFVDSSGIRIALTQQLRRYDSAVIEAGVSVSEAPIIPPFNEHFLSQGFCREECLAEALGDQEVKVFAVLLHAHIIARKIRHRHIRQGRELPPVLEDNYYDFDFQHYVLLDQERSVRKGDAFIAECEYDSSKRAQVTWGGLSTENEMCLNFLLYYPRMQMTNCLSKPALDIPPGLNEQQYFYTIATMDWTKKTTQNKFISDIDKADIVNSCVYRSGKRSKFDLRVTSKINITQPYKPKQICQT